MNFKLGEFVRFVDENREGYITKIIDEQLVGVTGEDDFEIPVLVTHITRVHGYQYQDIEDLTSPTPQQAVADNFVKRGVHLAVIPDANKGSIVHFYIINETSFQLLVALQADKNNKIKGEFAGLIEPYQNKKVYAAALPELDIWPILHIQLLTYATQDVKSLEPLNTSFKFKAKDFSGAKVNVPQIKQNGWLLRVDEDELKIDVDKLKESFFKPSTEKLTIERPAKELDLHIEKLRDDHQFLNKNEILTIQQDIFTKSLDAAIAHKYPQMIFIHGVGNGVLRDFIHKTISKHPQVKTFMDAQKEKFGYGATQVIFK
ncbi:recombination and DNA strand exchange inhibitor protein [Pedobacter glucosidilyticus]|nr:Smr/MutS family protein [Pedobacter glucosidilyticus]KHJ39592.1 recombination and DNA strand exchange inhibitor protein [Pedobacter glucosidilyticus]